MKLHKKLISASMALLASTSLAVLPTTKAQSTTHTVQSGEYLQGIAAAYGVTAEELRAWNGLSSDMIYVGDVLVVNGSSSGTVASNTVSASTAGTHVVQNGDVLYNLAIRYGVTVDDLMAWNGLSSDWLNVGDTLVVYGDATATSAYPQYTYYPTSTSSTGYHTVAPGDTLSGIAAVYGVSEADLWAWNGLSSDWLNVGDQIAVTGYSSGATSSYTDYVPTTTSTATGNYTVQAGDSLYTIALAYGTTVDDLMAINGLSSTFLQIGDQLAVPGADKTGTSETTAEETTTAEQTEEKEDKTETSSNLTDEEKAAGIKAKHIIKKGENLYKIANQYGVPSFSFPRTR